MQQEILSFGESDNMYKTQVRESAFVYGLLHANDNFMMAGYDFVHNAVADCYSNNEVEAFWACDGSIVHLKTHCPYFMPKEKNQQVLRGVLKEEIPLVLDLSLLALMKSKLQSFKADHLSFTSAKIEDTYSMLAELIHDKLYNQAEMDERMNYFIRKFQLLYDFDNIRHIVTPRKNSMELLFIHTNSVWTLIITILTLLASIIGVIVTILKD